MIISTEQKDLEWKEYFKPAMKLNSRQKLIFETIKNNPDRTLKELSEIAQDHFTFGLIAAMVRRQILVEGKEKIIDCCIRGKQVKCKAYTYNIGAMADRNILDTQD